MSALPIAPHAADAAVHAITRGLATWGLYLAVAILLGGPERFSSASYATALQVPGAPPTWGVYIGLTSSLVLIGSLFARRQLVIWGTLASAIWSVFFALSFLGTQLEDGSAGTTGFPTYLAIAVAHLVVMTAHQQRFQPLEPRCDDEKP